MRRNNYFLAVLAVIIGTVGLQAASPLGPECRDIFAAAQEQDQTICQKAQEITTTVMILDSQGVEGAQAIGLKVQDTYVRYQDAKRTLSVAHFLLDFTTAFEDAGVEVEGYTYENAARIAAAGKSQLDALEAKLDAIADELRGILDKAA